MFATGVVGVDSGVGVLAGVAVFEPTLGVGVCTDGTIFVVTVVCAGAGAAGGFGTETCPVGGELVMVVVLVAGPSPATGVSGGSAMLSSTLLYK